MNIKEKTFKRLKIQSWRRGMKEMDLILGPFIDSNFHSLTDTELLSYERILLKDDQEVFSWLSKRNKVPKEFKHIVTKIIAFISI